MVFDGELIPANTNLLNNEMLQPHLSPRLFMGDAAGITISFPSELLDSIEIPIGNMNIQLQSETDDGLMLSIEKEVFMELE